MKRLIDYFNGYYLSSDYKGIVECLADNAIFKELLDTSGAVDYKLADDYYFNFRSGGKFVNYSFREYLVNTLDDDINDTALKHVADIIILRYLNKYKRMLEVIAAEYNPIENYDRYEDLNKTYSSEGGSTEDTKNTDSGNTNTVEAIEGFNSTSFSDSNKATRTDDLTHTADIDRTHEDSGEEKNINHIHGNIGVTTADQMLTGYTDFWGDFNVLDLIYQDIDNIITTNTY